MFKVVRFWALSVQVNYHACPFERPFIGAHLCPLSMNGEMRVGLTHAYRVVMRDYADAGVHFREIPYVSPRLGYALDRFRSDRNEASGTLCDVRMVESTLLHGYMEQQDKIGGFYSKEEIAEQLIAGLCGPESPLWYYLPRKERIGILYVTDRRTDLFHFERDVDKDGDWILSNINNLVVM